MSVYCDGVGCHALSQWHGIQVCRHIGQSAISTSRHRHDMNSDVKATLNPIKQTSIFSCVLANDKILDLSVNKKHAHLGHVHMFFFSVFKISKINTTFSY